VEDGPAVTPRPERGNSASKDGAGCTGSVATCVTIVNSCSIIFHYCYKSKLYLYFCSINTKTYSCW